MATKKYEEIHAMSLEELQTELAESEAYIQKIRFEHAVQGLANPLLIRNVRRDIARLNTEIRRREIAEMTPEQLTNRSKLRERRRKGK